MKHTLHSLFFALLFALTVVSIGWSARSMMRSLDRWPAPHTALVRQVPARLPAATPAVLAAKPSPAAVLRSGRPS